MIVRLFAAVTGFVLALSVVGCSTVTDPNNDGDFSPAYSDQKLHVVGFGDSVTAGFCAYTGYAYVDLLVDNKNEDYPGYTKRDLKYHFGEVVLNNEAISGSTSCNYTASAIRTALRNVSVADVDRTAVLVTLGGNDLIHDYGCANPRECAAYCSDYNQAVSYAANYKSRMKGFLDVFKQELPNTDIFLANIYDPTDGVGDIENAPIPLPPWPDGLAVLALYNQTIAEIADEDVNVHLVDMRGAMWGHGLHYDDPTHPDYDAEDPSYWYCYNLEDPNERGYHEIRRAFWDRIAGVYDLEK